MRTALIALPAALALSACIEADFTLDVLGEDEARITGFIAMQRQMFEMAGADDSFCPDDEGASMTMTDTHVRCEFDTTGTFEEVMMDGVGPGEEVGADEDTPGEIAYLGDGRVRVFLPLGMMGSEMDEMAEDPAMMEMMAQMMAGLSVSYTVRGREIESSTGEISEDGTSANISFGVDDLMGPAEERPVDFETIVRY